MLIKADTILVSCAVGFIALTVYFVTDWIHHRIACRRRANLDKWQRRSLMEQGEQRQKGFDVIAKDPLDRRQQ